MDITENQTIISFCTGYGGIERGLDLAGVIHRVISYVEIEAYAISNLVKEMEAGRMDSAPIWSNLKTFPASEFCGRICGITAGYPCQPFSVAGQGRGADDPRHLWPYIIDHIKTINPLWVFLENVRGHVNNGLSEVLKDLESAGYETEWGIFSALEVGAPHRRERVFILAYASGVGRLHPQKKIRAGRESSFNGGSSISYANSKRKLQQAGNFTTFRERTRNVCKNISNTERKRTQIQNKRENSAIQKFERDGKTGGVDTNENWWRFEPGLGRVADGVANRIDRLRLLGNGVVPQQAAKAFLVLSDKLNGGV